jgi:hypothetical protein
VHAGEDSADVGRVVASALNLLEPAVKADVLSFNRERSWPGCAARCSPRERSGAALKRVPCHGSDLPRVPPVAQHHHD